MKLPLYLVNWFIEFLKNRKFRVKVNEYSTEEFDIKCGVPPFRAVLSPTLFSIYINDIPDGSKNKIFSFCLQMI